MIMLIVVVVMMMMMMMMVIEMMIQMAVPIAGVVSGHRGLGGG